MDYFSDYYIDETVTDKYGNPKKMKIKKMTLLTPLKNPRLIQHIRPTSGSMQKCGSG
jgi:hypothetical protein